MAGIEANIWVWKEIMSNLLAHSPADVIRALLIQEGFGQQAETASEWPIFTQSEPSRPDDCITTYDTTGIRHARLQVTRNTQQHYGIQVRVRSRTSPAGHTKINAITVGMEGVYHAVVTIGEAEYTVHSVNHASGPAYIGREAEANRMVFTVNFLACIEQTS